MRSEMALSGADFRCIDPTASCSRSRMTSDFEIPRPRDSASMSATSGSGKRTVRVFIEISVLHVCQWRNTTPVTRGISWPHWHDFQDLQPSYVPWSGTWAGLRRQQYHGYPYERESHLCRSTVVPRDGAQRTEVVALKGGGMFNKALGVREGP